GYSAERCAAGPRWCSTERPRDLLPSRPPCDGPVDGGSFLARLVLLKFLDQLGDTLIDVLIQVVGINLARSIAAPNFLIGAAINKRHHQGPFRYAVDVDVTHSLPDAKAVVLNIQASARRHRISNPKIGLCA